eukprot:6204429-Pyramimonas_sp.AAC.1
MSKPSSIPSKVEPVDDAAGASSGTQAAKQPERQSGSFAWLVEQKDPCNKSYCRISKSPRLKAVWEDRQFEPGQEQRAFVGEVASCKGGQVPERYIHYKK